jgi:cupin fold WbuC family metalloprotein
MDRLFFGKKLVAVRVRRFPNAPTTSVSAPESALQLLLMRRAKGSVARAHRHIPQERKTDVLQECIVVVKGKLRYDFFDDAGKFFRGVEVAAGEAMLVLGVAHAVEFLEDSLVYELKNGPFIEDKKFL